MKTTACRKLLAITYSAALLQGTSSFTTHATISKRRNAVQMSSTTLLFGAPSFPRTTAQAVDPLVNNRYSASDWLHNVFTLPKSSVLKDIRNPVITIAVWSTVVSILHRFLLRSSNKLVGKIASDMCIGGAPHSFLVSSLGLLLVFRTNSAYQRFNEGRVIWENILSCSRNISRMIHLYATEVGKDRQDRILNHVAAFPYLLRHHVRPGCLCEAKQEIEEHDRLLLKDTCRAVVDTRYEGDSVHIHGKNSKETECYVNKKNYPWCLFQRKTLTKVTAAENRPLWVCDRVGREVMSIPYGPNFTSRERLSLLSSVEKLSNTVGQCERIHQTAVPLNYARHSLRGLTLWLVTLPFCLVKEMGLLTGPAMAVISWLLFGVYQIGYSIEDPFQGSLRLSILCEAIRKDVLGETLKRESAYDLDDLEDDEIASNGSDTTKDSVLKELDLMEETVAPYIPQANQSDLILNAPSLVREANGSWTVVSGKNVVTERQA